MQAEAGNLKSLVLLGELASRAKATQIEMLQKTL